MRPDLRIVVQPAGRAATVGNARLSGLIGTCECHGISMNECPSLLGFIRTTRHEARQIDECARRLEGQIPACYTGAEVIFDDHDEGFTLLLWAVVCTVALVTGYSLGGLFAQWLIR